MYAFLISLAGMTLVCLKAAAWICLCVLGWALLGAVAGWAFSGHFAVWEHKLGVTMSEIGAMLGFVSAAFRVKFEVPAA